MLLLGADERNERRERKVKVMSLKDFVTSF
jgi:hypothetical protein